jgi:hypothetical protein
VYLAFGSTSLAFGVVLASFAGADHHHYFIIIAHC